MNGTLGAEIFDEAREQPRKILVEVRRLAASWLAEIGNKEVFIKNNVIFIIICNEIELTKNEILATICVLVVSFDMSVPVEIRLR